MGTEERARSFVEFAEGVARPLFETALLLCGDWHLAHDLVQETFARIYAAWPVDLDYPLAYARKTLLRTFLSHRRRRSSSEEPAASVPESWALMPNVELRDALLTALRRLPERERAVVVLRYWADRSVDDVAHDLGRSPGAVRTQARRGLAKLQDYLGADYQDLTTL